jgi:hypothetical protein
MNHQTATCLQVIARMLHLRELSKQPTYRLKAGYTVRPGRLRKQEEVVSPSGLVMVQMNPEHDQSHCWAGPNRKYFMSGVWPGTIHRSFSEHGYEDDCPYEQLPAHTAESGL